MARMILRWTLDDLPDVLRELGVERPFLVASPRWSLDGPSVGRWSGPPKDSAVNHVKCST